jgi:TRAP transporter 4TM/12TM fusion protein
VTETNDPGAVRIGPPIARAAAVVLASILTLMSIAYAFDLQDEIGLAIYPAQFYCAMFAVSLALAFLFYPARRGTARTTVPWYDWLAAVTALVAIGYLTVEYQRLVDLILLRPWDAVAFGMVMVLLSLEALRRATGNTLLIIVCVFIAYALLGQFLPGRLGAQYTDWQKLAGYLALDVNGILGIPLAVATTMLLAFLLFGQLLMKTGGSQFFTDIAMVTMGGFRGGPAKIAVVGSALFGSISGSAVANVVATGVVTIPMIRRSGYPAHKAAAIEAVASTGGQLLPPVMGAAAFLMAEFLRISYSDVVVAALVPALLYYIALFIQADLEAAKLGAARIARTEMPSLATVLRGLYFVVPFAVLIVALFTYNQLPQVAALMACALLVPMALALGYGGRRPSLRELFASIPGAGFAVLEIIMVCIGAGIVIGVLAISGLGFNLTLVLVDIGGSNLPLLLVLAAAVCIVLGMGLPTLAVYALLAALVAPALVKVGIEPIAAHLYVMYFGMMSMITPPVAIAAFAAAGLAGCDGMKAGLSAVRFGWTAYVVPLLFVTSPSLLLIGGAGEIALALFTAVMGVWLVSIAVAGYFSRHLPSANRILFAVAGLLALIPAGAFEGAFYTDIVGAMLGAGLIVTEVLLARARRAGGKTIEAAE